MANIAHFTMQSLYVKLRENWAAFALICSPQELRIEPSEVVQECLRAIRPEISGSLRKVSWAGVLKKSFKISRFFQILSKFVRLLSLLLGFRARRG